VSSKRSKTCKWGQVGLAGKLFGCSDACFVLTRRLLHVPHGIGDIWLPPLSDAPDLRAFPSVLFYVHDSRVLLRTTILIQGAPSLPTELFGELRFTAKTPIGYVTVRQLPERF